LRSSILGHVVEVNPFQAQLGRFARRRFEVANVAAMKPIQMNYGSVIASIGLAVALSCGSASGQADDICRDAGESTREINRQGRLVPLVYGRIVINGTSPSGKVPRVTVIYTDSLQAGLRQVVQRGGAYCFKRFGSGGSLVVDIDGVEAARRSVADMSPSRHREDFEVELAKSGAEAPPGVVGTRFLRPANENTTELYKKAAAAEADKQSAKAIGFVRTIVEVDNEDFIAWAKLGSLYVQINSFGEAQTAFERSLKLRPDYPTALVNFGILRAVESRIPEAIDLFKQALIAEPRSPLTYRLLGEAYLQNKQGSLGLATLDKALELDPVGMAECHLLKARLYDLAGAKNLATSEYKAFLKKVPTYSQKKDLERYIKENPE
jgi:hypothetical protein